MRALSTTIFSIWSQFVILHRAKDMVTIFTDEDVERYFPALQLFLNDDLIADVWSENAINHESVDPGFGMLRIFSDNNTLAERQFISFDDEHVWICINVFHRAV